MLERNRPLTDAERALAQYLLTNGEPSAATFLEQLPLAEVTPTRCPCGCASIDLQIKGHPEAPPGVKILGDFLWGPLESPAGVFIYENNGLLSGIEVYGLAGDAPRFLPRPDELRPFSGDPEGIARGEEAIAAGRTITHDQAFWRFGKWLRRR